MICRERLNWLGVYRVVACILLSLLVLHLGEARAQGVPLGTFTDVKLLPDSINRACQQAPGTLSTDGREFYFFGLMEDETDCDGLKFGKYDFYRATRSTPDGEWESVEFVTALNTDLIETNCDLSHDGTELYFTSNRVGSLWGDGWRDTDLWFVTREDPAVGFESWDIQHVNNLNTVYSDGSPSLTRDGRAIVFTSNRPDRGDFDLYMAERAEPHGDFGDPWPIEEVNTPDLSEWTPQISGDGLVLLFCDATGTRGGEGGAPNPDFWFAVRPDRSSPFGEPVPFSVPMNLGPPVNSPAAELFPMLSPDWPATGSKLYFYSGRNFPSTDSLIYEATWILTPQPPSFVRGDVNGDGRVDISDMVACLNFLFLGADTPTCLKAADINDEAPGNGASVNVSDPVYGLNFLFLGGPPIPPPFPVCGQDPTGDVLSCETFARCQ